MDNILFLGQREQILKAYTPEQIANHPVLEAADLNPACIYSDVHAIFSTWGFPVLSQEEIAHWFPNLKELYYAAGTVQRFARPYLSRGVRVFSAWAANAIPVAQYTLGQILLANKGYFQLDNRYRTYGHKRACEYADHFDGNYHNRVGLLGAGMIGKKVIEYLKPFELEVLVFDPFMSQEKADLLGVKKASLEEIFQTCPVVSNHLANKPETVGILHYGLFSSMSPWGVFINTGRGAQVVMPDLIRAMEECPGRTALLDVTDPDEPLPPNHPLLKLPNILVTPHRAGSFTKEIYRLGVYMMEEYERIQIGQQPLYEVTPDILRTMA